MASTLLLKLGPLRHRYITGCTQLAASQSCPEQYRTRVVRVMMPLRRDSCGIRRRKHQEDMRTRVRNFKLVYPVTSAILM